MVSQTVSYIFTLSKSIIKKGQAQKDPGQTMMNLSKKSAIASTAIAAILGTTFLLGYSLNGISQSLSRNVVKSTHRMLPRSIDETEPNAPYVAWIMSFPCAGSDFVIDAIQKLTGRTTATNYGHIVEEANLVNRRNFYESEPVFHDRINGPFIFANYIPLPSKTAIPTLTYCGGYCARCYPGRYVMKRDQFMKQCLTGTRFRPSDANSGDNGFGWTDAVQYDGALVKKAAHVARDPFDIVQNRFLYYSNVYAGELDWSQKYDQNRNGFLAYCNDLSSAQRTYEEDWYDAEIFEASLGVLCYAEFYKLIQWHNLACETTEYMFPEAENVKVVYYEDFYNNFEQGARDLLSFYEMTSIVDIAENKPLQVRAGAPGSLFTDQERAKAKEFMTLMASPCTQTILSRYLA